MSCQNNGLLCVHFKTNGSECDRCSRPERFDRYQAPPPPAPAWAEVEHGNGTWVVRANDRGDAKFTLTSPLGDSGNCFNVIAYFPGNTSQHIGNAAIIESAERMYRAMLVLCDLSPCNQDIANIRDGARQLCTAIRRRAEELKGKRP